MKRAAWLLAMIAMVMASSGAAWAKEPKEPPGYVVTSFWDGIGTPQVLTVIQEGAGKKYYVAARRLSAYRPTEEIGAYSGVAVQKLPPGKYFASKINITSGGLSGELDFAYEFTVESGKATYIGEYHPILIMGKWFGFTMPTAAKYSISDQLDRDKPIAIRLLPPETPFLNQAPEQPLSL